jgi:hypothetical protein
MNQIMEIYLELCRIFHPESLPLDYWFQRCLTYIPMDVEILCDGQASILLLAASPG